MVSYAQNHEDVLLARVFAGVERGFYVDIGAFDPTIGSVTRHFYDHGWCGINVEPGGAFSRLVEQRPRDINLQVAVADHQGRLMFYEHPADPGTSTLLADLPPRLSHLADGRIAREVPVTTLERILEEYADGREIDFLKVDVEGYELEVLRSNDWMRFRPKVLLIEATEPYSMVLNHESWEPVVLETRYAFAHFDGINRWYVRGESIEILELLRAPVNVLDNYVDAATVAMREEIDQLRRGATRWQGERAPAAQTSARQRIAGQVQSTKASMRAALGRRVRKRARELLTPLRDFFNEPLLSDLREIHDMCARIERTEIEMDRLVLAVLKSLQMRVDTDRVTADAGDDPAATIREATDPPTGSP